MKKEITIEETLDWNAAWRIIHDPAVEDRILNDEWKATASDKFRNIVAGIVENPNNYVLLVSRGDEAVGVAICYHKGSGEFEIHTIFMPGLRGADAIHAGKLCTQHMLAKPEVERLVSMCPENLPETYLFARRVGWRFAGMSPEKWIKNGVAYAQKLVEATKKDLILCH